ncbi:MAG: tungsten formylmethanofuran dehydrogenase [Rhizobiaceae bacterium]|nr:tungsten formylmethanofuran dehydrogenase [Rhizobiaceae bacterium]
MSVAWIGDRETPFEQAAEKAAALLHASRCPLFTIDADTDGTRAAIGLAKLVGAAYDHPGGASLARETTLFTDQGGMFVTPGEARRRADVLVVVGALPDIHLSFLAELFTSPPDLPAVGQRRVFVIGNVSLPPGTDGLVEMLSCGGEAATLAALRAQCAGRKVATPVQNFDRFAEALAAARFPVFLFSGRASESPAIEMLQGLVSDLNRKSRAAALFLPASESGWGSTLASTWLTGFPMRTGFARGFPEYDPWRFDAARMIADGEADLHLHVSTWPDTAPANNDGIDFVALQHTDGPVAGAQVTIAVGEAGIDHDAVLYSSRTGTFAFKRAPAASSSPPAAAVLRAIAERVPGGAPDLC